MQSWLNKNCNLLSPFLFSQATKNVKLLVCASSLRRSSQTKRKNKRVFHYCQTSVLFFFYGGFLSGYWSLLALHLSGTPSLRTGTRPPSCLQLPKRPHISSEIKFTNSFFGHKKWFDSAITFFLIHVAIMGGSLLNHSLVFKDWLLVNYTLSLKLSAIKQKREGQKLKKKHF